MAPMDGILVEQVLVNLMENSALHGETTTKIRISVQKLPERVLFCVEDNGKGIDPAILPIIFEGQLPTGDHAAGDGKRSMGIGLSVCMSIIQAHQGDMKVPSIGAITTSSGMLVSTSICGNCFWNFPTAPPTISSTTSQVV